MAIKRARRALKAIANRTELYRVLDECKTEDEFTQVRARVISYLQSTARLDDSEAERIALAYWRRPEFRPLLPPAGAR